MVLPSGHEDDVANEENLNDDLIIIDDIVLALALVAESLE